MRSTKSSRFSNYLGFGLLAALPMAAETCETVCNVEVNPIEVNGEQVGEVTTWSDGTNLHVAYKITDPYWDLDATHLYVSRVPPTTAFYGQYPYTHHQIFGDNDTYEIPLMTIGATAKTRLYVAAEANLKAFGGFEQPSLQEFGEALPTAPVGATVAHADGVRATWMVDLMDAGEMSGTWTAWSSGLVPTLADDLARPMNVVSSYSMAVDEFGLVGHPEELDRVNWILNHYQAGELAADGRVITAAELQTVIWTLLDEAPDTTPVGKVNPMHVNDILEAATWEGAGYVPGCLDEGVALLVPTMGRAAPLLVAVPFADLGLICEPRFEEEAAWAEGTTPIGFHEGEYFEFSCY